MAVRVFILFLIPIFLRGASGADASDAAIDIQPIDPRVREGDDVILNCFGGVEGAAVHWYQVDESYPMFQSIERNSFPGGRSLRLLNASRLRGEDTSSTSFACADSGSGRSRRTAVTVVPRSAPGSLQSSLVVSPANPVAQNGSSITLTCIDPSENETDIGWYVSKVEAMKFASHEVDKFENGAFLRIVDISVESAEEEISVVCLQSGMTAVLTKSVMIRVTEMAPTTEPPENTHDTDNSPSVTVTSLGTTAPDREASATVGVSPGLVLVAIAIGAGLAVFCICLIFLSVYTLFHFRYQSFDLLTGKRDGDDVFKITPRSIDNVHPYQSVTDREGGAAGGSDDGLNGNAYSLVSSDRTGKSGYTDLNPYDLTGAAANKAPYTDLTPYDEPRVYARLESESAASTPTPAKREVTAPDGIYDSEIGTQISSFKQEEEETSQV